MEKTVASVVWMVTFIIMIYVIFAKQGARYARMIAFVKPVRRKGIIRTMLNSVNRVLMDVFPVEMVKRVQLAKITVISRTPTTSARNAKSQTV